MVVGNELNYAIANMSVEDAWVVHPIPGYVVKFKEIDSVCRTLLMKEKCKLFLNICHCAQLPPPEDLSERKEFQDEVAQVLDSSDPSKYRIPLCVGDVEVVSDRKGDDSVKIDVIINSTFYLAQLEKSEFFRQLLLLVISEAIEKKHGIKVDVKGAIKLKNRKCMGDLSAQRIRKKPREAFISEIESVKQSEEPIFEHYCLPKNCLVILRNGKQLEINLKLASVKPPITNIDRLNIRMNDDHLLIILDQKQAVLDIYFPVKVNQSFISQLERVLGKEAVKVTAEDGENVHDWRRHRGKTQDVIVVPKDVGQVSSVMKMCNKESIPVVPFSTTSGLDGFVNTLEGGVFIDLMSMDKIVEVNASDFNCTIEPGVTHETLNQHLHSTGLWFPGDVGADTSICGTAATSASDTNTRYGSMAQNVLNLEVVLSNGDILYTAGKDRRPRKWAAGYNLTKLFVGSKGTLGVITQAAIRLYARPAVCSVAICPFRTVDKAIDAVVATLQCSVPTAKIDFLDTATVVACNRYSKLTLVESPSVFMEFHGNSEAEVAEQASLVEEIFASHDGREFTWCHAPEEQKKIWTSIHSAYYAILSQKNNAKSFTIRFSLPTSALTKAIAETRKDIDESGVFGALVGHVGDGSFHCIFLVDESNQEEMKIVQELSDRIVKRALALGGSCSDEHEIGISKRKYFENECGEVGMKTMIAIKKALDPKGIMNPKELFPED